MIKQRFPQLTAELHGGMLNGETLTIGGTPTWPEYLCVQPTGNPLKMHYRHVAAGVYDFIAPCVEVKHPVILFQERCPDCGSLIHGGDHGRI